MKGGKVARLIMVTDINNNKYYNMTQVDQYNFKAEWGRVGGHNSSMTYDMYNWRKKYNEKLKKGYRDVTELAAEVETQVQALGIDDPKIRALISKLQSYAKGSISKNYLVTSDSVTQSQVDEAQELLNALSEFLTRIEEEQTGPPTHKINDVLLDLYHVIPRRMKKVNDHLLPKFGHIDQGDLQQAKRIVSGEQDNLDVMAQQVGAKQVSPKDDSQEDVLEAMGLKVAIASSENVRTVKSKASEEAHRLSTIYKVTNLRTQKRFDQLVKGTSVQKVDLLWHGSRNENWLSILDRGLLIRPTGVVYTGSMFGNGIYFANRARKSMGYSSVRGSHWTSGTANRGYVALFNVYLGNQWNVKRHSYSHYDLNRDNLQRKGYDSVFASKGADLINDEFIVYDGAQCTVAYLVEIR
jgi:poly [ADP-ribose] polymerase